MFPNCDEVERDCYRRTGILPLMLTVVVCREFAAERPECVRAVYDGFCAAKDVMREKLVTGMTLNNIQTMISWPAS